MNEVSYPSLRDEIIGAVEALADPVYQRKIWIEKRYPTPRFYDDLDMSIHILFDDTEVLPEPRDSVGSLLFPEEVAPLRRLGAVLDLLIGELGAVSAADYVAHPQWGEVVDAAGRALAVMRQDRPCSETGTSA